MSEADNMEKMRALSKQWGGSLFGVADLRSFKKEEILLPPSLLDSLPYAISVGFHLSDAVLEEVENQPTPLYFHHYQINNNKNRDLQNLQHYQLILHSF